VIATKFGLVPGDGCGGYVISGRPDYVRNLSLRSHPRLQKVPDLAQDRRGHQQRPFRIPQEAKACLVGVILNVARSQQDASIAQQHLSGRVPRRGSLPRVQPGPEKASRVVELLLATVRPWQLMSGKVLGIGVIGLAQFGLIVAAGAGTALGRRCRNLRHGSTLRGADARRA
jgi:hypothetical protein